MQVENHVHNDRGSPTTHLGFQGREKDEEEELEEVRARLFVTTVKN